MGVRIIGDENLVFLQRLSIPQNIESLSDYQETLLFFRFINDVKYNNPADLSAAECNFWVQVAVMVSRLAPDPELLEFYRALLGTAETSLEVATDYTKGFWNTFAILFCIWTGQWRAPRSFPMKCGHLSTAVVSNSDSILDALEEDLQDFCASCSRFTQDAWEIANSEDVKQALHRQSSGVSREYPNKFAGLCYKCGAYVEVGKGSIEKNNPGWLLKCKDCGINSELSKYKVCIEYSVNEGILDPSLSDSTFRTLNGEEMDFESAMIVAKELRKEYREAKIRVLRSDENPWGNPNAGSEIP